MPCNLAVTIAKAAVTNEQLLGLLTPDLVVQAVNAACADLRIRINASRSGDTVYGYAELSWSDQISVAVNRGRVEVQASDTRRATEISDAISGVLTQLADALFSQQIAGALASIAGKQPVIAEVNVDESGTVMPAFLFSVKY